VDEPHFLDECRRGSGLIPKEATRRVMKDDSNSYSSSSSDPSDSQKDGFQTVHYNANLVKKAIHLYRNPFHNIVSRYHLEHSNWQDLSRTDKIDRYANNEKGFQLWCRDLDSTYDPKPKQPNPYIPDDVMKLMQAVPCRGEFFRYIQWHNLANAVVTHNHKPTIIIHYENYDKQWNQTVIKILDFLHLTFQGTTKTFRARSDYDSYFTTSQQKSAKILMQRLATEPVWHEIERYFEDL
jgi:Sulfotransferase domain